MSGTAKRQEIIDLLAFFRSWPAAALLLAIGTACGGDRPPTPDGGVAQDAAPADQPTADRPQADVPCVPTSGPELCNGRDDDCNGLVDDVDPAALADDPLQCGACSVVCPLVANATPLCRAGRCEQQCFAGSVDVDGRAGTGCECVRTGDTEACDGRDNDCDGQTDEGFDVTIDSQHCGLCGNACSLPFALTRCERGLCALTACLPGYLDRDRNPANGCEAPCQPTQDGVEACDGLDNDCDGLVDEDVTPPPALACKTRGVCTTARKECRPTPNGGAFWTCAYGKEHEDPESRAEGCDGLDNDCDGLVDEAFGAGGPCVSGQGVCAVAGTLVCDPEKGARCQAIAGSPATEVCNGLDDDCDGLVDELASAAERTADDQLVYLASPDMTIFAHEASRPDSSATGAGVDGTRRPCAVSGRLPWAGPTSEEAQTACSRVGPGWRLCTAAEWSFACSHGGTNAFPYGARYQASACNGADRAIAAGQSPGAIATAVAAGCTGTAGSPGAPIHDLSGNLREWVRESPTGDDFALRGGAWDVPGFDGDAPGLRCTASLPGHAAPTGAETTGFRCCRSGRLP